MAGPMRQRKPKADKSMVRAMPKLAGFHAPQKDRVKQEMPVRAPKKKP